MAARGMVSHALRRVDAAVAGGAPIAVERIAQALGKSPEIVRKLAREAAELNQLDEIFAVA